METSFLELPALIEALAEALLPLLDKPFALFGHSFGTLVSFELARHLRTSYGTGPIRLFVSAGPAPQIPHRGLPIHNLPEREFLEKLRRSDGTPVEVLQQRMESWLYKDLWDVRNQITANQTQSEAKY